MAMAMAIAMVVAMAMAMAMVVAMVMVMRLRVRVVIDQNPKQWDILQMKRGFSLNNGKHPLFEASQQNLG